MKVAIIDANAEDAEKLCEYLLDCGKNHQTNIACSFFKHVEGFLVLSRKNYDIIFLNCEGGSEDAIKHARSVREADTAAALVLTCSNSECAVGGYEVCAADYWLKPLRRAFVEERFSRLIAIHPAFLESINIITKNNAWRIRKDEIFYVEVMAHYCYYHLWGGKSIKSYETLSAVESKLGEDFLRCNSCYIVNARYVKSVENYDIMLSDGSTVQISKRRRAEFMRALTRFFEQYSPESDFNYEHWDLKPKR